MKRFFTFIIPLYFAYVAGLVTKDYIETRKTLILVQLIIFILLAVCYGHYPKNKKEPDHIFDFEKEDKPQLK